MRISDILCIFAPTSNHFLHKKQERVNKLFMKVCFMLGMGLPMCQNIVAQETAGTPILNAYTFSDGSLLHSMSNNGKWAVAYGADAAASAYSFPKLINLETQEVKDLLSESELNNISGEATATDVTDDGNIVVGSKEGKPGYWTISTGKFTTVKLATNTIGGRINAVTPDGRYAVGQSTQGGYDEVPMLWDLENGTVKETNWPKTDLGGQNQGMTRFIGISADGRYIVGCVSYSYPSDVLYFVYDRDNKTTDPIGFDYDEASKTYSPKVAELHHIDGVHISANGKWVGGNAYLTNDAVVPYRYNLETGEFECFNNTESQDKGCVTIDNMGTIYASTPAYSPSRTQFVMNGNYWYSLDELLKVYGIDFYKKTGYDATGYIWCASDDCKTVIGNAYISQESYMLTLPVTFAEACGAVNLLSDYSVTPRNGSSLTNMSNVSIKFTRNVEVLGNKNDIVLKDEEGNTVKTALKFAINSSNNSTVEIGFRTVTLDAGKKYTIEIPAGTICVAGDRERTNEAITLTYTGHGTAPVAMTAVVPENNSTVGHLSMTTNPVVLTFDTDVKVAEGAVAQLYRNDEGEPFAQLNLLAGNTESTYKQVMVYPTTIENLYKGNTYRIVIEEGAITDLSGASKNEKIEITYEGSYERTVVSDDTHIYQENFALGMTNMMLYDGDHNTPVEEMQAWMFNATTTPWWYAADDDYSNTCAVSHSMYDPAGKSNDWMVTPQLYIPDGKCFLSFKAQSFRKAKTDKLKVIVYATEVTYNDLTDATIEKFINEGDVVMDEVLSPGANEGILSGEWQNYSFKLDKYAGKNIYIAFVNENENQSAVFVTDIQVVHNQDFTIALTLPESVVAKESQEIKGTITVKNGTETYSDIKLQLLDANNNVVDEIAESGLSLKVDDKYEFAFSKPLPLTIGTVNNFSISIQLGSLSDVFVTSIKNLAFTPTKRIVLEENTGQGCQNCPLGHLAIDKLTEVYGDRFIPLCYHTYTGDNLESGMTDYTAYFLGMTAAPQGRINRGAIASPMVSYTENGVVDYTFYAKDGSCWMDIANEEFAKETEADINIDVEYDETTGNLNIPYSVKFALSQDKLNIGMLCVVTEDNLSGFQQNNLYSMTDEDLGEWQKDGAYGKSIVRYVFNDVARALYPSTNYNGQLGLIPTSVEGSKEYTGTITINVNKDASYVSDVNNCKVTCMMIDANTGAYINAARAAVNDPSGIDSINSDNSDINIYAANGNIYVNAPEGATVNVYSVDGQTLATTKVNGSAHLQVNGNGMAIVRVAAGKNVVVKKIAL